MKGAEEVIESTVETPSIVVCSVIRKEGDSKAGRERREV